MTTTPLVDIALITYNQEKFIAQAVESVLMQQTGFEYRLFIGDDCSTDNTQPIVTSLARKYPDRIKTIFDSEHRGLSHRDRVGLSVLKLCTAKYVAMLDGDDYWTDPYKLQKQVDFLENHPDCSICFHDVMMFYEDRSQEPRKFCRPGQKEISTIEDLLAGNFIQTCSVMFRNHLFGELPDWFYSAIMGDWILHILNGQYGKIGYLNEVMAAYRVHQGGFWTSLDQLDQVRNQIQILDHLDDYLDIKYTKQIEAGKAKSYQYLSEVHYQRGDIANAWRALIKSLRIFLSSNSIPNRQLLGRLIKLQTYKLYEWLGLRFTRT